MKSLSPLFMVHRSFSLTWGESYSDTLPHRLALPTEMRINHEQKNLCYSDIPSVSTPSGLMVSSKTRRSRFNMTINLRTSDIVVICGRIETGKTTLLRHLTRRIRRRIYWDFNHEHSMRGYVVHYVNQIRENFDNLHSVVFQPLHKRDRDFLEFIEEVSHIYNVTLILEELERYARGGKRSFLPSPLEDIIDTGSHHKGQGLYITCRRVGDLHRKVFFNAHHIFALEQHRPQDIKYLADTLGSKAYMLHSESAEKHDLQPLPPYYFLHYDHRTTHVRKKVAL